MASENPLVSVIIPAYNRADLLPRAMQSVLAQTFADWELIVVDDGSTDGTQEAAARFADPRVRVVRHDRNRGLSAARNSGIAHSRGEYVAFLDSDDEWLEAKLARQVEHIRRSESRFGVFYCPGYIAYGGALFERGRPTAEGDVRRALLSGKLLPPPSGVVVRRSLASRVLFDEALRTFEELDFYLGLARETEFALLNERLFVLHLGTHDRLSWSPRRQKDLDYLREKWRARLEGEELALFNSLLREHDRAAASLRLADEFLRRPIHGGWAVLARGLRGEVALRKLLRPLLVRALPSALYRLAATSYYRCKDRYVGRYPSQRRPGLFRNP